MRLFKTPITAWCALACAAMAANGAARGDVLAVRGQTIYTMAGEPIKNGVVLVRNGKIEKVGPAAEIDLPEGCRVLAADIVTPGLIDAHTVVGLTGYLNQRQDQEQVDRSEAIQPELRAIDAYDPREPLVEWLRSFGITTIHTGHAPGEVITGQTMIVKTTGKTIDDAVIVPTAMIATTLGDWAVRGGGKAPGTKSKAVAMLRAQLIKAQAYRKKQEAAKQQSESNDGQSAEPQDAPPSDEAPDQPPSDDESGSESPASQPDDKANGEPSRSNDQPKKKDPPDRDLRMEALVRVLNREIPLLVTVHRASDISTALRLAKEFDIRMVLDGASEAYLVREEIRTAGVPVILHPTMMRSGKGSTENAGMETASILRKAGIPLALQSGFESYVPKTRVVLFEAGVAASNGLLFEDALASITIDAAKILGIDARVGSIEPGKDADFALYDGDPFEYTTHCIGVVIDGEVVSQERR